MSKTEADNLKKIEIWWLLRDMKNRLIKSGDISWGEDGSHGSISYELCLTPDYPRLHLSYIVSSDYSEEKKEIKYMVPLIQTDCHFGSTRFWFKCSLFKNGEHCGRRVGMLYKAGDYFGCRHCYELTYSSRNENRRYKMRSLFRLLELEKKIEKIQTKKRKYTHRGRLNKNGRRLELLQLEMNYYYENFKSLEESLVKGEKDRNKSHKTI
jgi:hypothetical protein